MFDFKVFIENLRENPEKKDTVEKYEKLIEPLPDKFEDTKIYKEYLSKFDTQGVDLVLPEFIDEDFDLASIYKKLYYLAEINDKKILKKIEDISPKLTNGLKAEHDIDEDSSIIRRIKKIKKLKRGNFLNQT